MIPRDRIDGDAFSRDQAGQPVLRPGAFADIVDVAQRLKLDGGFVIRKRAGEILPVATTGDGRTADRAAEVEGEDLRARIATKLQRHQRQQHGFARPGRTDDQRVPDIADMG